MGIYGAALATILGLVLSFLMGIYYFARKHKALSFTLHGLSAGLALRCMVNGASEFVDQLAIAITTIVFNRTALAFAGEDGVAAVSIIMYTPKHGYAVMQFIEEKTGGRLSLGAGTLYGALNSLQEKKWIEPCGDYDGRKKEYHITMQGKEIAEKELARLNELVSVASEIIGEVQYE